METRLEHFDGTQRRSCTLSVDGARLTLDGDAPRDETFESAEAAEAAAGEALQALRQEGWVVAFAPDPEIARYYAEAFWDEVGRAGWARRDPPGDLTARLEALHAASFPDELRSFLEVRDAYALGYERLAEWRIWGNEAWAPDPADGNLFEQLVVLDQQNYLGTAIAEYAARMVYLGSAGNGDVYFAGIDERFPNRCAVAFWNHETQALSHFVTDSVATLAYANHLLEAAQSEGEMSSAALQAGVERIAQRAALTWHYGSLEEATGVEPELECESLTRFYYYRALPFVYLLHGRFGLDAVQSMWEAFPHDRMDFEAALEGPFLVGNPVTSFYWLWRLFFFGKDAHLERALAACAESASPLVRDQVALIEELLDGRAELGQIADVHALRAEFQALDLDPDRAEARAREQEEAARLEAERKAADEAQVAAWVAGEDPAALVERAWAHVGNATIVEGIYAHLRDADPSLAADLARWEFITGQGYSRGGKSFSEELEETWEALAASGDPRIVPLLLTSGGFRAVPVAAQVAGERVVDEVRRCLETREEYNHVTEAGIRGVRALGPAGFVDELLAMLDEFAYDPSDMLAGITGKRTCELLIRALGESRDRRATAPLSAIARGDDPKLIAPALVALGVLGDPAAAPLLAEHVGGAHTRPALYALARLGAGAAEALPAVDAWLKKHDGLPELLAYPRVMRAAIAAAAGEAPDLDVAVQALGVIQDNRHEGIELHVVALGLLAEHGDPAQVTALAAPFLDAEYREVREAALTALQAHGAAPELRCWDRRSAERLCEREGGAGLARELTAPGSVFRHNLLRVAVDRGLEAEVRAAGEAYAREAARFEHYTYQFARDEWKRLGYGLKAAATLSPELARWLLTHPNTMVRKVFQYHSDALKEAAAQVGPLDVRRPARLSQAPAVEATARPLGDRRWAADAGINGVAWTPDGRLVAVGENGGRVFDAEGRVTTTLAVEGRWSYDVEVHPDGALAAVGSHGGHLYLVELATGAARAHLRVRGGARKLRFSPDGTRLAVGTDGQWLVVVDVATHEQVWAHEQPFDVNAVDWLDAERLVFGTDKHLGLIRVGDDAPLARTDLCTADLRVFADGTRIVAGGSSEKGLGVFDAELSLLATHPQTHVARVRLSPDEQTLFTAVWEGDEVGVWRWDLASGAKTLCGHADAKVFGLDLDAAGRVAAGGKRGQVVRFGAEGASLGEPPAGHRQAVEALWALPGGRLLTGSDDRQLIVWDLEAGVPAQVVEAGVRVNAVAASADGQVAFVASFDSGRAIDLASGETRWTVELARSEVVAPVGDHVVFGSRGELVWVAVDTGEVAKRATISEETWLEHLVHLEGDRYAVAGYREHQLEVWDLAQRERLRRIALPPSDDKPDTCAYSAAGDQVWISRWDRSVQVVDAAAGEPTRGVQLNCPHYPIAALPDRELLVVARGSQLQLLSTRDWLPVGQVETGDNVESLLVLPDGRLVCGGKGGRVTWLELAPR